jgi:trans-aconitate methyltransferase
MTNLENTWRDSSSTFDQQLQRNIYELGGHYPPNWYHFLHQVPKHVTKIVDIGCGAGALYKLCQLHFPQIQYVGYDYSPHAIALAKKTWQAECFEVKQYQDLTPDLFDANTMLVANALADVLPNGDECIEYLLQLDVYVINLHRVKITKQPSYYEVYDAYDIQTYAFYHNFNNLRNLFQHYKYDIIIDNYDKNGTILDILLTKKTKVDP